MSSSPSMRMLSVVLALFLMPGAVALNADEGAMGGGAQRNQGRIGKAGERPASRAFGVQGPADNIKYKPISFSRHSPGNAALRSALIPGWGQVFNQQRVKGISFFTMTALAATGALSLRSDYRRLYDQYEARGLKDDALYDEYKKKKTQSMALGVAAGLLWLIGIVDAHQNAYNPVFSREGGIEVIADADSTRLEWRKRF